MSLEPVPHDRRTLRALADRQADQAEVFLVGQGRRLAGGATHNETVGAVRGEMVHQRDKRFLVHAPPLVERGHDRGQDRAETSDLSLAMGDALQGAHRMQYSTWIGG